jgi:hypothetical protein
LKLRRIVGSLLMLGFSGGLAVGATALPAAAEGITADNTYHWQLSPEDAVIQPGQSITYTVTLVDQDDVPVDPQPSVVPYVGTDAGGDIKDGLTITANTPGPRAVMAVAVIDGKEYTGSTELSVVGPLVSLAITPSATTVDQGGSLTFAVSGADAWGKPVDVTSATLTSSVASDVVDGLSVTFPTASPHTVTASLAGITASVTVQVAPAATVAAGASDSPGLAETGFEGATVGIIGGALLLAGLASVLIVGRRRAMAS